MSGQGGFFGSQAATPISPTPVSVIPGAQGLGQSLVNYFNQLLTGATARQPYMGYQSVYGGPNNTFPTASGFGTATSGGGGGGGGGAGTNQSIQDAINNAVAAALSQSTGGSTGPAIPSTRDAGGGAS